jgi:hypothetical protein
MTPFVFIHPGNRIIVNDENDDHDDDDDDHYDGGGDDFDWHLVGSMG